MSFEKIMADLERHVTLFDLLTNELGQRLCEAAADGVKQTFNAVEAPDGTPWPDLSSDYARFKARFFPGMPMLVREGVLIAGLDGVNEVTADEAVHTSGQTEQQRLETGWNEEGDALNNRPARRFVGLTDASKARSTEILLDHFETNV
jgi:hypothetical protein